MPPTTSAATRESSPIQKLRKSGLSEVGDFISDLPDGIIGEILSRLPIKDAVSTCVLSKDWKFKWTNIYNVNVDVNKIFPKVASDREIFREVVERILCHLTDIRTLHLSVECRVQYESSRFAAWLLEIWRYRIESLELDVFEVYEPNSEWPILSSSHLSCALLKNLALKMPCSFKVAAINLFPKLTRLHLHGIEIVNEHSNCETMIFTFPLLKKFDLLRCKWLNVKFVEINAPSLTTFWCATSILLDGNKAPNYIKITGPMLEDFTSGGGHPENIILSGSTVGSADLDHFFKEELIEKCGLGIRKLFQELSHVKFLELRGVSKAIAQTKLGAISLPRFLKLEKLYMNDPFNVEGLLELLHAAPLLKFLHIHLGDVNPYDYDAIDYVPSCVVSHIETLELDYVLCSKPNLHLAKFFLKNGLQLKNVYICSRSDGLTDKIVNHLLKYPTGSTCVKIGSYF